MSNPAPEVKVTSVRRTRQGRTERVAPDQARTPAMTMRQAGQKWSHLKEEVARLPWSQVPADMLADFLLAGTEMLRCEYGDGAMAKASEVLAISLAERDALPARISGACTGSPASIELQVELADEAPARAPEVAFELQVPEDANEEQIREGLAQWGDRELTRGADRLILDPGKDLPSVDQSALVRQIEALMGDQTEEDNQFDALLCASAMLVVWEGMERRNAALADFTLSGLTAGKTEVAPGKEVRLQFARVALDEAPTAQGGPTKTATVRHRPS